MQGFQCAGWTLILFFETVGSLVFHPIANHSFALLREAGFMIFVSASGLINPGLLLYLAVKPTQRRWILFVFGILFVDAICVLAKLHSPPSIGFFLWLAGIILTLAPRYRPSEGTFTPALLGLRSRPGADMPK